MEHSEEERHGTREHHENPWNTDIGLVLDPVFVCHSGNPAVGIHSAFAKLEAPGAAEEHIVSICSKARSKPPC